MKKNLKAISITCSLVFMLALAGLTGCQKEDTTTTTPPVKNPDKQTTTPEGNEAIVQVEQTVCPVMGEPINKDIFVEYKGKRVYFCCPGCEEKFLAEPEKYLAKLPQFKTE